jgi:S-DNA-T family DNA segregation ATPase FtsK/SpoIIIE
MPWELIIWLISAGLCVVLVMQPVWEYRLPRWLDGIAWGWVLGGYPLTVGRMVTTWRRLCIATDLAATNRPRHAVIAGDVMVSGSPLRPSVPRLGLPRLTRTGLRLSIRMLPGQTPALFLSAAEAMTHTWRVYAVRVVSPRRGWVTITATARDPLADDATAPAAKTARLLSAVVGRTEDGGVWTVDLRSVPHWLVVGATQSGKSTLLASWVSELAPQPVALVGIDCKGGLELSLFGPRLSALASSRTEAAALLGALVVEIGHRMAECRAAGVRSVWELPDGTRPVPLVVLVDELAELYLSDGSKAGRAQVAECSTALLRLAQLGAALGLHLIVAGQRVGSELGPGVTALRAQLGGRICHRVHDEQTALMALGDLSPDAVAVAQTISGDERGVAVATVGASWLRVRSTHTTTEQARLTALLHAKSTPAMPGLVHAVGGGEAS